MTYNLLKKEPAPRMLLEALKLYGVTEKAGSGNNPEILSWAKETGLKQYTQDETPWCGLLYVLQWIGHAVYVSWKSGNL